MNTEAVRRTAAPSDVMCVWEEGSAEGQRDRQTDRQIGRQTETDRQTERQTVL